MGETELKHYGVKGMKWGVRRNIGIKARAAANYKTFADGAERNVKRLEARKKTKGLTDREVKRLDKNKELQRKYTELRNTLIKDLSKKDIQRGERALNERLIFLGGPMKGVMDTIDLAKANKLLERDRNR